ncbi:alpha,alpha-trehalase TreF [Allomuricauda sp. SCSIO 65647]|uniref:alpha,alpha-trehalase TreF n=1 Tax=Allomuricauda sp. SCSIO 65647 TaxID=2908843 RepID=UPI001F340AEA|nr:alpha,alpha-trehalase TreF [Muricauda sp. SCSIO 65647]UJH67317.1 alpha,alpha-trehalase TreF [Muricauda sp. SCSIO 65647]
MRLQVFSLFLFLFLLSGCRQAVEIKKIDSLYESQLFKDVQLAAVYEDSKTFVDLVPKGSIAELEIKYLEAKKQADFDLEVFVKENFEDRSMKSLEIRTDTTKTMYEHIENMWDKLARGPDTLIPYSSRIPLPHRYVVPGGRFQEIYYWDSYFTIEGLLAANKKQLAKSMVDNFAFLLDSIGFIPNGTRDYFLTRSQPPFFGVMVSTLAQEDKNMLVHYLPEMAKEYKFFMAHDSIEGPYGADQHVVLMTGGGLLNRYWDKGNTARPEAYKEDLHLASEKNTQAEKERLYRDLRSAAESGWDFSSRWYLEEDFASTGTTSIVPVDLNCLLYHLETQLAAASRLKGDEEIADHFAKLAGQRKNLIRKQLWNEEKGFFMDFNFETKAHTPHLTLAGAFPLFFGIADQEQAEKVKNMLMETFLKDGGLVSTLNHSGQQWDAPNGWAPLQWMAVKGLLAYGYEEEAREIMERWLALNEKVFKNTGKMMEKYNVEDLSLLSGGGEYETQDGFGWTNGVALGFKRILDEMEQN